MKDNPYMTLAKFILPGEMTEYFDLTKVESDWFGDEQRLHLYLDEKNLKPEGTPDAIPNGFYEESCINDFPIREYRTPCASSQVEEYGRQEHIKRLAYGCQKNPLLKGVCGFF